MTNNKFKALATAAAVTAMCNASAIDSFDPATNKLTLGAVQLNGTNYGNVVATINSFSLLGVDGGASNGISSFNPSNNLLTLGSVTYQGTTYNNVRVTVNSYALQSAGGACAAPAMANSKGTCISPPANTGYSWNSVLRVWVADIGVLVTGANQVPTTCLTIGDACWEDSIASGLVKFANSGVTLTGINTRPIIFAFYTAQVNGTVYNLTTPIYADVVGKSVLLSQKIENGGVSTVTTYSVKGSTIGLKQSASDGYFEKWYDPGGAFVNKKIDAASY